LAEKLNAKNEKAKLNAKNEKATLTTPTFFDFKKKFLLARLYPV